MTDSGSRTFNPGNLPGIGVHWRYPGCINGSCLARCWYLMLGSSRSCNVGLELGDCSHERTSRHPLQEHSPPTAGVIAIRLAGLGPRTVAAQANITFLNTALNGGVVGHIFRRRRSSESDRSNGIMASWIAVGESDSGDINGQSKEMQSASFPVSR